ncbi:autotransporter outer membrane beta-barrel domain-containing protein, partial [Campylobacter jejuni]|nr:autotransporter outer membrane beta-barrel domain-containing protein [Campylobacter jejuni]
GIETGATINTFTNSGLIKATGSGRWSNGIWVSANSNIKTFTNTGTLQGDYSGIITNSNTTIDNFTNKGTIKSTGNMQPYEIAIISSGVYLSKTTIKTFTNTGLISSNVVGLNLDAATIDNLTNTGTINSTSSHNVAGAISINTLDGGISTIKTLTNEGVLKSNSNGILAEAGNKIDTLINKGTIEANLNGITFFDYGNVSGNKVELGNIILEKGSSIKAGNNGINIDGTSNKPISVSGSIEVKEDASVSGSNAGIVIGSGKEVSAQITVEGSVTGGAAGIVNEGVIGSSSSEGNTGGIVVSGGSISSSSG